MSVAAVGQGGEHAVVEPQQSRVRALGGPRRIPRAEHGAHAHRATAGEEAHDVDLVRGLAEHDAAALLGAQLLGPARAIEEIRVVERLDHAHAAEIAAPDQLARGEVGRVEAVAVPDDQVHAGRGASRDHVVALGQRQRHRLLDQHVLAHCRGELRMRGMEAVGTGDVDRLHGGIGDQLLDACVRSCAEIALELRARRLARVAGSNELDARIGAKGRQHQRERAAQADDAETDRGGCHRVIAIGRGCLTGPASARRISRATRRP